MPLNLRPLDHLALRGKEDAPALLMGADCWTFAWLEGAIGRLAAWLQVQGPEKGARVAIWTGKSRLACLMPLAAARAGLVHVPINPLLKGAQAQHILDDCGANLLIANAGRIAALDQHGAANYRIIDMKDAENILDQAGPSLPPSNADPASLAAILYTSGSTGKPKGVMLSHINLWLGAQSVAGYLKLSPADRVLAVLPLSFDYGQNQLFSTWYAGGAVAPIDYLSTRDIVKAVDRFEISTLAGVPPLWVQLIEAQWPAEIAAKLKRLTNSGGALTANLISEMRSKFPKADIVPMYGLTEAFRSTYLAPDLVASHPQSIGKAIEFAEILICRPDGSICEDGEVGELVHCGPLVAQGYWQDEARTAERFRPAPAASRYGGLAVWSGDSVRRDGDGLLFFEGRSDAMIKSSGNRISPSEVEDGALGFDLILEAVAFGVADERLGQAIILIVRGKSGAGDEQDQAALVQYLRQVLPNFMQPRIIEWRSNLPRNPNGKLDRVEIAAQWQADNI